MTASFIAHFNKQYAASNDQFMTPLTGIALFVSGYGDVLSF
jgi:hypothetical protein